MSEGDKAKDAVAKAIVERDRESLEALLRITPGLCTDALISAVWTGVHQRKKFEQCGADMGIITKEFLNAIESENRALVDLTLQLGGDPNAHKEGSYESIFVYACKHASKEVVKLMMDHHACWNFRQEWSPIQSAFGTGREEIIELFLDLGIDGDDIDHGDLLHHYCRSQTASFDLFMSLVKLGADIFIYGNDENNVLENAISGRNLEIIKFLINNGALEESLDDGPLYNAISVGRLDIVELLLDHGAHLNISDELNSPIAAAATTGHEEMVKLLLKRGAEKNTNALAFVIRYRKVNMLRFLVNEGFDASARIWGTTVLSFAVQYGNEECVMVLLDHGVDIGDNRSENGKTALHYAAERGHREIAELLLQRGADINDEDNDGLPPVSAAIQHERHELGKFLVRQMVYLKYRNEYVSEDNLTAVKGNEVLKKFYDRCVDEMEKLKNEKLPDSFLSYFDVLKTTDDCKLAALLNNQNVRETLVSDNFKYKFPIYNQLIYDRCFVNDIWTNRKFELFNRFVKYLSTRNHDQLPALPFTVASKISAYLSHDDVTNLLNV